MNFKDVSSPLPTVFGNLSVLAYNTLRYPHTVTYKYTRGDENTDALCRIDADPDGKVKTVVGLSDFPSDWAYFECFQKKELLQWFVVSFKAERHGFADDYDSCKRVVSRQLQAGTGAYDIYVKTTSSYYITENLFFLINLN